MKKALYIKKKMNLKLRKVNKLNILDQKKIFLVFKASLK